MSVFSPAENLKEIQNRIVKACESCGRSSNDVTLIAVSKTKPIDLISEVKDAGQLHFGENKVQELQEKMPELGEDVIWHMIGTLQTNKIKYLVERVDWIHSIPKIKALKELEKRASKVGRTIKTLIQVNISNEDQKSGCDPEELEALLKYAQDLKHVRVEGLMGIATFIDDLDVVRSEFRLLREIRDQHQHMNSENINLKHLSMGMTNDLEVAIEEGSTMVRVGTAIFGSR